MPVLFQSLFNLFLISSFFFFSLFFFLGGGGGNRKDVYNYTLFSHQLHFWWRYSFSCSVYGEQTVIPHNIRTSFNTILISK